MTNTVWLTTGDQSKKLSREQSIGVTSSHHGYSVWVDRNKRRQIIEGFGAAVANSAAYNLFNSGIRGQIMADLFGSDGLGIVKHILFSSQFSLSLFCQAATFHFVLVAINLNMNITSNEI